MGNKRGEGYVQVCVLVLILCLILSVFLTFVYAVNFVKITERNAETVLENYVMKNSIRIYNSIKQGTNETDAIDAGEYITDLTSFCTFNKIRDRLYHYDGDGNVDYYISEPTVRFAERNKLKLIVSYTTYVPIYFAGTQVTTATIPVTVKLNLEGKF
ncbi:MAG: hypothetical protein IJQ53_00635 [Clostridia bacterium]|nr:hypothetical protein [Clostridia bacterium]